MAKQQTTDKKTLDLIKEVQRQKSEIAKIEKPSYRTNCSFSYQEGVLNGAVNIHVESDVKKLVLMAAFLREKEVYFTQAARELNVDNLAGFTWMGYSVNDWIEDFKMRISKLQIASKKKKLEALEARLNAIISPELRAELELQAIADELT